ncbi:MAG: hypothetical protein DWQ07_06085 [Chloroflexi bacterium]|nr:MAG: hypothetical protein DWQ07_06085 [Chloroflexota bacterium]MBL1196002.1 hypothetical protein [Chloroflexota bacterium]NOH13296.1 hypothetical protein [Chloroflexota bacterium]
MISISVIFWLFITLFGLIGIMRGWAKEVLVTFSGVLSLFIIDIFRGFIDGLFDPSTQSGAENSFWFLSAVIILMAFFGYQSPRFGFIAQKTTRERLTEAVLGAIFGGVNAYLVVGSIWSFLARANYFPELEFIIAPLAEDPFLVTFPLPPDWMAGTPLYVILAILAVFIVAVFI